LDIKKASKLITDQRYRNGQMSKEEFERRKKELL